MKGRSKGAALLLVAAAALLAGCGGGGTSVFGNYEDAESYEIGNGSVASAYKIAIEWTAGEVVVQSSGGVSGIVFEEETSAEDPACLLHYRERNGVLDIKYAASGARIADLPPKRLTVTIPMLLQFSELDIETYSAPVKVDGVQCTTLDVETHSGGVIVYDFSASRASIETDSGDVVLELGEKAAFAFHFATERGRLNDEFESMYTGVDSWQHGASDYLFSVKTVSGGLYLRKRIGN